MGSSCFGEEPQAAHRRGRRAARLWRRPAKRRRRPKTALGSGRTRVARAPSQRQAARTRRQRRGQHERDEWKQPQQVLRGDELRERQDARHGRRGSGDEALLVDPEADDEPEDDQDRAHLQQGRRKCESVRQRAGEIARECGGGATDDLRVVDPEPIRRVQDCAAEALELQGSLACACRLSHRPSDPTTANGPNTAPKTAAKAAAAGRGRVAGSPGRRAGAPQPGRASR
jgi:hypothetical protein